jgi:hypothetical protein
MQRDRSIYDGTSSATTDWLTSGDTRSLQGPISAFALVRAFLSVPSHLDGASVETGASTLLVSAFEHSNAISRFEPTAPDEMAHFVIGRSEAAKLSEGSLSPVRESATRWQKIVATLEDEGVEDGVTHPAEALVEGWLAGTDDERGAFLLHLRAERRSELRASIVKLAGRVGGETHLAWRKALVETHLRSSSVDERDAAVQAVEQWEDPALVALLQDHSEEVPWLQSYIDRVIDDIRV